jgi:hypothetical protein
VGIVDTGSAFGVASRGDDVQSREVHTLDSIHHSQRYDEAASGVLEFPDMLGDGVRTAFNNMRLSPQTALLQIFQFGDLVIIPLVAGFG